jgi:DNA repair protein RecO (recombination protein O)
MSVDKQRQEAQLAFVLHSYPYLETSLIVEVFTQNSGRIAVVAKGAKRPTSTLRGLLRAFQPLLLSWGGKSELRTLHKAEWQGGQLPLQGTALICGFYLNELLIRLLHRNDPHERLFACYQEALSDLSTASDYIPILRRFEQRLLQEMGYALTLDHDVSSGKPIKPNQTYCYEIERGPVASSNGNCLFNLQLSGKTLLDMSQGDYSASLTRLQSRTLMRSLLNHYLGDKPLHTRQLLKEFQQL